MTEQQRKRIRVKLPLDLLTTVWGNRGNEDTIDDAIEKFLIAGLKAERAL